MGHSRSSRSQYSPKSERKQNISADLGLLTLNLHAVATSLAGPYRLAQKATAGLRARLYK